MRRAFGMTLIALAIASIGYMFYGTVPMMWELFETASPGERVQMVVVLALCAVILVCRVTVAVISRIEDKRL